MAALLAFVEEQAFAQTKSKGKEREEAKQTMPLNQSPRATQPQQNHESTERGIRTYGPVGGYYFVQPGHVAGIRLNGRKVHAERTASGDWYRVLLEHGSNRVEVVKRVNPELNPPVYRVIVREVENRE